MSSSISSSDGAVHPRSLRNEWKVVLSLVVAFMVTEVGLRLFERNLSVDIAHIRCAPVVATQIGEHEGTFDVLVLGNSSARAGIAPELLKKKLEQAGCQGVVVHFFYPDGGNIGAWRWAWRRYFAPPLKQPNMIMICGSKSHFDDAKVDPVNSANYFVAARDMGSFALQEIHSTEGRIEFFLAGISVSYASRPRVQRRFMDMIMPFNRQVLFEMAETATRKAAADGRIRRDDGSNRLIALLDDLRVAQNSTFVVALPSFESYEVSDTRISAIQNAGAHWIDLRAVAGLHREHFYDKAHVNHEGAVKVTAALADALSNKVTKVLP
jgi:hypothetical protein